MDTHRLVLACRDDAVERGEPGGERVGEHLLPAGEPAELDAVQRPWRGSPMRAPLARGRRPRCRTLWRRGGVPPARPAEAIRLPSQWPRERGKTRQGASCPWPPTIRARRRVVDPATGDLRTARTRVRVSVAARHHRSQTREPAGPRQGDRAPFQGRRMALRGSSARVSERPLGHRPADDERGRGGRRAGDRRPFDRSHMAYARHASLRERRGRPLDARAPHAARHRAVGGARA